MNLAEYASYDALGIAALIKNKQISSSEVVETALRAIAAVNRDLNAIIETYPEGAPGSDTSSPADGPFAGVPFLVKDVGLHFAGIKCEFCSRLCEGMVTPADSHYARLVKGTGVNIVGRTNTPEFSMSGTSENLLYVQYIDTMEAGALGQWLYWRRRRFGLGRRRANCPWLGYRRVHPRSGIVVRRYRSQAFPGKNLLRSRL